MSDTALETRTMERTFHVREFDADTREFVGIGVPWDKPAEIRDWFGSYTETFERGAVKLPDSGKVLLYWRHSEPIGLVIRQEDTEEGWQIRGRISETPRGNEAYVLLRDGVVDELSIGFLPVTHREDDKTGNITRTEVEAREVSLVPFGAYGSNAKVSEVREETPDHTAHERSTPMADDTITPEDLKEVREQVEEHERSITALRNRNGRDDGPAPDMRSAGALLKAIVAGDEEAIRAYNRAQEHLHDEIQGRAYTGGTTADAPVKDAWVGDLTRIFDSSSGVLADFFGKDTLPQTGMNIEYAQLKSNTIDVTEQANEGDDLPVGKVQLETLTAPVKTYGGATQLSLQEIQRSTLPVLNRSLEALTVAAAKRRKAILRAKVASVITARKAIASNGGVVVLGATLAAATADNWENALIDAAIRYDAEAQELQRLFVSATVFKKMRSLTVSGERVFKVAEDNASGVLDLPGLRGSFAGVPVSLDPGQAGDEAYFANKRAITQYLSALYSLQDTNVINLSKDFSVYFYGAVADEIPQLIVPVKLAAS